MKGTAWKRHLRALIWLHLLALMTFCGCAMFGGGESSAVVRSESYSVTGPPHWTVLHEGDADTAYRLPSGNIVTVSSSCKNHHSASLEVLTKHLLIGSRSISFEKKEKLQVAGSDALYSKVRAVNQNTPVYLELVVLTKDTCVFDFTLMAKKAIPAEETDEFMRFVKGFNYGQRD